MATYVKLQRLFCHRTEDWTGNDEAFLRLNGAQIWGPVSVDDDSTTDINMLLEISGQATVELFDEDLGNWLDQHDFLGSHVIRADEAGGGDKTAKFTDDQADYTLYYKVATLDI